MNIKNLDLKKFCINTYKKYYKNINNLFISILYIFAIANLGYTIKNTLGFFPEIIYTIFPFMDFILNANFFKFFATPEKIYFIYIILLELSINKSIITLPLIVRYNILFIFFMEMIQNLILSYWDLFLNKESIHTLANINKIFGIIFCYFVFILSFFIYVYVYLFSIYGKIPSLPGPLRIITDSISFWLKIKKV